jgi:hypothetical protein
MTSRMVIYFGGWFNPNPGYIRTGSTTLFFPCRRAAM